MKKTLLLFFLFILGSCSYEHPEYEANKKLAEKWVETFETQNMELWEEVVSEDVVDVAPMYGMGQIDYAASKQIAEFSCSEHICIWCKICTDYLAPDLALACHGS